MYGAASAVGVETRIDWIDPSKPSVQRYSLLDDALPAHVWSRARNVWGVDRVYAKSVDKVMPRVRDAATEWAVKVLHAQELAVEDLKTVIDQRPHYIHEAAKKARDDAKVVMLSGRYGMTTAEAHAVLDRNTKERGHARDRHERVAYRRAVKNGKEKGLHTLMAHPEAVAILDAFSDLHRLMAHPKGVAIVDAFAASADTGRKFTTELLDECAEAIRDLRRELRDDESIVWRFPPAVAAGVAGLGRPDPAALTGFALLWARVEGGRTQGALEVAGNAILALQIIGGPLGAVIGEVLDFVLSVIGASVAFLQAAEQDQAAEASTFAADADRLSQGSSRGRAVLVGVAAIAAAVALPGTLSQVAQRARRGTKRLALQLEPVRPPSVTPDLRAIDQRGISREGAVPATERMTDDARRGTIRAADTIEVVGPGERVAMGPVPEPNPVDLSKPPLNMLRGADVGTKGRWGTRYGEFTIAEVSHGLRTNFDPERRLPRSVEFMITRESAVGGALPSRKSRYPLDRGLEPEFQLRHGDYALGGATPPPIPKAFEVRVSGPDGASLLHETILNVAQPGALPGVERGHLLPRWAAKAYPTALEDIDVIRNLVPMQGRGPLGVNQGSWALLEDRMLLLAQSNQWVTIRIDVVF